ncbi:YbaB/EbfC family nucleoid-associated protein [Micromonospora sp. NPDC051196]|uniref:YbaB/EbfC family nucleoid-associated protein n=1 Tax=Micromonospora sp. NPDC051196 TaxID=3155281 RepID=UPI003432A09F
MQPAPDPREAELQRRLAAATATGRSTDGMVTIVVGGLGDVRAVRVDPRVLHLDEVTPLETAVTEALRAVFESGRRLVTDTIVAAAMEMSSPARRSGQETGQGAVFGDGV